MFIVGYYWNVKLGGVRTIVSGICQYPKVKLCSVIKSIFVAAIDEKYVKYNIQLKVLSL
jgi:hypothetical protein